MKIEGITPEKNIGGNYTSFVCRINVHSLINYLYSCNNHKIVCPIIHINSTDNTLV